jgi:hypothetical protein
MSPHKTFIACALILVFFISDLLFIPVLYCVVWVFVSVMVDAIYLFISICFYEIQIFKFAFCMSSFYLICPHKLSLSPLGFVVSDWRNHLEENNRATWECGKAAWGLCPVWKVVEDRFYLPSLCPMWAGWHLLWDQDQDRCSQAVNRPRVLPSFPEYRHLLSIFFILISQGMKVTTKLQASRANFRQS